MYERFTERARNVVVQAQASARDLKQDYIGTEHILLGVLLEEEGVGGRVLTSLGVTAERVRTEIVRIVGVGKEENPGQIPLTPRCKKVLELALREALSLGHNYIGTEHILLGLIRENESIGARILLDLGADPEKVRNGIVRHLNGPRGTAAAEVAAPFWVWHDRGPATQLSALDENGAANEYARQFPGDRAIYVATTVRRFRVSTSVEAE